eukprot:scaffold80_cov382-Prasinococcus_capsulatus_cf.AAC.17
MAISLRLGLLRSLRHGCPQQAFVPALTADVGFWATLSLNMCDFTRYANSQRSQLVGQAMGLPLCMAVFGFLSLAITASTIVIYGTAITDPLELLGRIPGVLPQTLTLAGLIIATLTTNIAANVVAPANAFVNIAPRRISFEAGGLVAAGIGAVILPWKLISDSQGFIFTWLIAYSALLGPVAGVMFADFFILRQRRVEVSGAVHLPSQALAHVDKSCGTAPCAGDGSLCYERVIILVRQRLEPRLHDRPRHGCASQSARLALYCWFVSELWTDVDCAVPLGMVRRLKQARPRIRCTLLGVTTPVLTRLIQCQVHRIRSGIGGLLRP